MSVGIHWRGSTLVELSDADLDHIVEALHEEKALETEQGRILAKSFESLARLSRAGTEFFEQKHLKR